MVNIFMRLKENECIVKTFHHHSFIFFVRALKIAIVSLPFFLVGFFVSTGLTPTQTLFLYIAISVIFTIFIVYDTFFFYLDRLIVTNFRIVYVEWRSAFRRDEHEAELEDIQDISTEESGILSALPIFDFGTFRVETASKETTIIFTDAPDPEGIKHFIYHINIKPTTIRMPNCEDLPNDQTQSTKGEDMAISGRPKV